MNRDEFLRWPHKAITLLGMSGVGKTTLAYKLPKSRWFHYSGDYRIGTKYLAEPILDNIKRQAMQVDFLRDLLRSDSIYIASNITVDNLQPDLDVPRQDRPHGCRRPAGRRVQAAAAPALRGRDRRHARRRGVHRQGARDLRLRPLHQRRRRQHLRAR